MRKIETFERVSAGCITFVVIGILIIVFTIARPDLWPLRSEIRPVYDQFYEFVGAGDYQSAYMLMSLPYRDRHTMEEFGDDFQTVSELRSGWTIIRISPGKVRVCCTHPGASFAPSSTMTYVLALEGQEWLFTGEKEMWLD